MKPVKPSDEELDMQVLADLGGLFQRERAAQQMMAPGYVRKLLDLFRVSTPSFCFLGILSYTCGTHKACHRFRRPGLF